uniref:Uncharacterized protein n=1 Tax=Arundo donax TaxID=35708 RepID=A0A0A9C2Q3_ARUDO
MVHVSLSRPAAPRSLTLIPLNSS